MDHSGVEEHPWRSEARNVVRAFAGAFLFGAPLLLTMEMWWLGELMSTTRMFAFLGVAFAANLALARFVGFKKPTSFALGSFDEAIDAVAVGIVGSVVVLLVLNRITLDEPLGSIVGKIVVQALPLSVGASIANAVFGGGEGRQGSSGPASQDTWKPLLNDVGATAVGAVLIGASIAPTEEVPMLASGMQVWHEIALVLLSLLLGYMIVFASGFDPEASGGRPEGPFQHPVTETALAYLVSLAVSFGVLLLTQRVSAEDPISYVLSQVIVLGFPCMIGGAAGRLAA